MSVYYAVGRYACKITDQSLGEAKTGTPQLVLRFQVLGVVDPKDPTRYLTADKQYERTAYRFITEKTMPYLLDDLKALGFEGSSFHDLDPNSGNFQDFRGRDVDMWCSHETGQDGNNREKWGVAKHGSFEAKPVTPLEPKKLRDLDNLYGKQLKALVAKPTAAAPSAPPPVAVGDGMGITDDDVPF